MRAAPLERAVLFVSERPDLYGGGQESLCDLSAALERAGVRPLVALPGPGPLAESLSARGVESVAVPIPGVFSGGGLGAVATIHRLRRVVRQRGIRILHGDSPRSALLAGLAARLTGRPHVFHLRAQHPGSALSDRLLFSLSDRVIAVSAAAAERSAASRGSRKVRVIHTGLPPIDFLSRAEARRELGLPPQGFVCGVVGRVETDKGREEAVGALSVLRGSVPDAILMFLGPFDGNDPWMRARATTGDDAGDAGGIRFAGGVPHAARRLKAFDLLLHPSRHEALPRAVIEAMFASVPVVAAAVGGVPELIESGRSGLLVPARDPDALGRAAAALARDEHLRARLAAAAQARARSSFTVGRMVSEVLEVYRELDPSMAPAADRGTPVMAAGKREALR